MRKIIIRITYSLIILITLTGASAEDERKHLAELITSSVLTDLFINLGAALVGGVGAAIFKTKDPSKRVQVKATLIQDCFLSILAGGLTFFATLNFLKDPALQLVIVCLSGWLGGTAIDLATRFASKYVANKVDSTDPRINQNPYNQYPQSSYPNSYPQYNDSIDIDRDMRINIDPQSVDPQLDSDLGEQDSFPPRPGEMNNFKGQSGLDTASQNNRSRNRNNKNHRRN